MRTSLVLPMFALVAAAGVVDRVAVVVANTVITETEVLDELRLTEFLNSEPLDLGPQQRRAAAERLVDQELIRQEMKIGRYPEPSAAEANTILANFRQQHFHTEAEFRAALVKYGITEDQLKQHLLWQTTAMRFTEARFRPLNAMPEQSADRQKSDASDSAGSAEVDKQMAAWLDEARRSNHVTFKSGAFQ